MPKRAASSVTLVGTASPLHKSLSAQRKQGSLIDMRVRTSDGQDFNVHRCVLAASSDFMEALFSSGMRDSEVEVKLESVKSSLFSAFLDFVYNGVCEVEESELAALLEVATHLQSSSFQQTTLDALVDRMEAADALPLWQLGEKLTLPVLAVAATRYAAANFQALATCDAILQASCEQLTTILQHDDLEVMTRYDVVFDAIARWEAATQPTVLMAPLFRICKELSEQGCTVLRLVTPCDLRKQIGTTVFYDVVDFESLSMDIRIKDSTTLRQLKKKIWRMTGVQPSAQRLWSWSHRLNGTYRIDDLLQKDYDDRSTVDVMMQKKWEAVTYSISSSEYRQKVGMKLYLEQEPTLVPHLGAEASAVGGFPPLGEDELILFLKFYDPPTGALTSVGTHIAKKMHTLEDLLPVLRAAKGLPAEDMICVYEEVSFEIEPHLDQLELGTGRTLLDSELGSGDILVFQRLHDGLPGIPDFFEDVRRLRRGHVWSQPWVGQRMSQP